MEQEEERAGRVFRDCSGEVRGACIEVHRLLGPGLLESAYQTCLAHELRTRGLTFEEERPLPISFKGVHLECGYRLDFVVERELIIEIKAVERLLPIHQAQVITYLKLTGLTAGLLVNFHEGSLRRGLRRLSLRKQTLPNLPSSCEPQPQVANRR